MKNIHAKNSLINRQGNNKIRKSKYVKSDKSRTMLNELENS